MRELAVGVLLAVALLAAVHGRPNAYEADGIAASERFHAVRVIRELEVASDTVIQLENEAGEALVREKRGDQLDDWLTEEQKEEIKTLKADGGSDAEVRDVIMRYYEELDDETRAKYDSKYKSECIAWVKQVASDEEFQELKTLYKAKDVTTLENKIEDYMGRLSDKDKEKVLAWKEPCRKLWEVDQAKTIARRLRRELGDDGVEEWNEYLSESEREDLSDMHADGAVREAITSEVHHVYLRMPPHHQRSLKQRFRERCLAYLRDVAENDEYETYVAAGFDADEVVHKYFARLIFERHNQFSKFKSLCHQVLSSKRKRREIDAQFSDWMSWMNNDQKTEISGMKDAGKSYEEIHDKVIEHFNALDTSRQGELRGEYKEKCKGYFRKLATSAELEKMNELFQSGKEHEVKDIVETVIDRQPDNIKASAKKFQKICTEVFGASARKRRTISDEIDKTLSWLTPEQKIEIKKMHEQHRPAEEIKRKFWEYLHALDADKKKKVTDATIKSCYAWLDDAASQAERDELQRLHHIDHNQCKEKVYSYLARLPEERQNKIRKYLDVCERLWYGSHHADSEHHEHHHRRRRHGDHSNLNAFVDKYLQWMTAEEKLQLEEAWGEKHDQAAVREKVMEIFDSATGEKKQQATNSLKAACKSILIRVIGEDNARDLEELKASGASTPEIATKVHQLTEAVTDPKLKALVDDYGSTCRKVFQSAHRARREEPHAHEHSFEHYITHHLQWLTEEQKEELKSMKEIGANRRELQEKVLEFYESAEGEAKEQGTKELQHGCREIMNSVIGHEKAAELNALKGSGASFAELEAKLAEMIEAVPEDEKKQRAMDFKDSCKAVFGMAHRSRRHSHEHSHSLQHYLTHHLKWLTDDQKDELKLMKVNGRSRAEMHAEILKYYNDATGDLKKEATKQLRDGCRELLVEVVGHEEAGKVQALKEGGASFEQIENKINELIAGITDDHKKKIVEEYGASCKKLFRDGASRRRRHGNGEHHDHHEHGHGLENYLSTHLKWLTSEQKDELRDMKTNGMPRGAIQDKVFEFFDAATGETKEEALAQLQGGCRELLTEVVGKEEAASLKTLKETGASAAELQDKFTELLTKVTDEHKKHLANVYGTGCKKIFGVKASRKRRHGGDHHDHHDHGHSLENYLTSHLNWLAEDQKDQLRGMKANGVPRGQIEEKVFEFFDSATGETKEVAIQQLQEGCRELITEVVGGEEAAHLKTLKETGASATEIETKINSLLTSVTDEHKKQLVTEYGPSCRRVFGLTTSRRRRHDGEHHDHHEHGHSLENYFTTHLKWLTSEQKDELRDMKTSGIPRAAIEEKIFEFFEATAGETREEALEQLQGGCRELLVEVVGKDSAAQLKTLKETGASFADLQQKFSELLANVNDEHKKQIAHQYGFSCRKIFGVTSSRVRRHGENDASFDDFVENHLKWLNADQKAQIDALKAEGKSEADIHAKVAEFYKTTDGDVREEATQQLQGACKELLVDLIGKEKVAHVKAMRESGASVEEIESKLKELFGGISDVEKKKKAATYGPSCRKLFGGHRQRRDHGHTLEEYFQSHLSWLNDDQKDELRSMKIEGESRKAIEKKIFEFYHAAEGETKEEATEKLQDGCRKLFTSILGAEKAAEMRVLKERGASFVEIEEAVSAAVADVTDEKKKQMAAEFGPACKQLFRGSSRQRRDHHHGDHTLEDYFKTHLKWLSADQKDELRAMKSDGKSRKNIQTKIMDFYKSAEGETKELATEQLKGGCNELLIQVVGEDKANDLKKMKESGATIEEMAAKVDELINGVEDDHKKKIAQEYGPACKRVFGAPSRKRRDHHHHHGGHKLEDYFKTHLRWLTDAQKDELLGMKADGKSRTDIQAKVFEFYNAATGEKKEEASEQLKGGCRELLVAVVGKEKAGEVKILRETGASFAELQAKVDELLAGLEDEGKKKIAEEYGPACRKVFAGAASRKRRDHAHGHHHHGHHTLEDYFKTHLKWLSEEQKDELRDLKKEGKSTTDIQKQVFVYFDAAAGETKEEAVEQMKGGCRELIHHVVGADNAKTLKHMKESGASQAELQTKIDELIGDLEDEHKKKLASDYGPACKRIFGVVPGRFRRHRDERSEQRVSKLQKIIRVNNEWLTEPQVAELKQMLEAKAVPVEFREKLMQFYEATEAEDRQKATLRLQATCKVLLTEAVGEEKVEELDEMRRAQTPYEEIIEKVDELFDEIEDEKTRREMEVMRPTCERVMQFHDTSGRQRRTVSNSENHLEMFREYLEDWLSEEQMHELEAAYYSNIPEKTLKSMVLQYYLELAEPRRQALEVKWKGLCLGWLVEVTTDEQRDNLQLLMRTKQIDVLREQILVFMNKLDDRRRQKVALTREVCENLFGLQ